MNRCSERRRRRKEYLICERCGEYVPRWSRARIGFRAKHRHYGKSHHVRVVQELPARAAGWKLALSPLEKLALAGAEVKR